MNSFTYKYINILKSSILNDLLFDYFKTIPKEEYLILHKKEAIPEKRKILQDLVSKDPERLKSLAEYLYSNESGYGSDDEELFQEWHSICPKRNPLKFGSLCEHCNQIHHALSTEPKCNCSLHFDVPNIYDKYLSKFK